MPVERLLEAAQSVTRLVVSEQPLVAAHTEAAYTPGVVSDSGSETGAATSGQARPDAIRRRRSFQPVLGIICSYMGIAVKLLS